MLVNHGSPGAEAQQARAAFLGKLPQLLARQRIAAVEAVVAAAEVDLAVRDRRSRFSLTFGLEVPQLLRRLRLLVNVLEIEAIELAVLVVVPALADVQLAVGDARG